MQKTIKIETESYIRTEQLPQQVLTTLHFDKYKFQCRLGKGSFGQVWSAFDHKQNRKVAIKILNLGQKNQFKPEKHEEHCYNELKNIMSLRSNHIVKYLDDFISEDKILIFIVMEFCEGPTLFKLISDRRKNKQNFFNEQQSLKIIYPIALGIQDLHSRSMMHRDIKPDNIIKDKDNCVIIDLGLSKELSKKYGKSFNTPLGHPCFQAPQVILQSKKTKQREYGLNVDVWSLGAVLFYILTGDPFITRRIDLGPYDYIRKIKMEFTQAENGSQSQLSKIDVSNKMRVFLSKMLEFDPDRRYSIKKVLSDAIFNRIKQKQKQHQVVEAGETKISQRKQQQIN